MGFFKGDSETDQVSIDVIDPVDNGVLDLERNEPTTLWRRVSNFLRGVVKKIVKGISIAIVLGIAIGLGVGIGGQLVGLDPDVTIVIGAAIGYVSGIFVGLYVLISIILEGRKLRQQ